MSQVAGGGLVVFAELLGIGKGQLSAWRSGKVVPCLSMLLGICHALDVHLVDFLSGDFHAAQPSARPRRTQARRQWTAAKLEPPLREELDRPIPSLAAVAQRVGCDAAVLRMHQPQLAAQIVAAGRERRHAAQHETLRQDASEVRRVVAELIRHGLPATKRRVEDRLQQGGILRHPATRRAWRSARGLPVEPTTSAGDELKQNRSAVG
jgi:transcriptional regulator with XRE-family HTH domain